MFMTVFIFTKSLLYLAQGFLTVIFDQISDILNFRTFLRSMDHPVSSFLFLTTSLADHNLIATLASEVN